MKKENVNQKELRTFNHPLDGPCPEGHLELKIVVSGKSIKFAVSWVAFLLYYILFLYILMDK